MFLLFGFYHSKNNHLSILSDLDASEVFIKCGEWDTQQEVEPKKHQTIQGTKITIHPGFYRRGVHNDLAVVHLETKFQLDQHINTICLATSKVQLEIICIGIRIDFK